RKRNGLSSRQPRGRAAVGAGAPLGVDRVAAFRAMMARHQARRRLPCILRLGPVDAGEKTGLAGDREHRAGAVAIGYLVVALVFFEKPAAREGIPADRNHVAAARADLVLDALLVDEVH